MSPTSTETKKVRVSKKTTFANPSAKDVEFTVNSVVSVCADCGWMPSICTCGKKAAMVDVGELIASANAKVKVIVGDIEDEDEDDDNENGCEDCGQVTDSMCAACKKHDEIRCDACCQISHCYSCGEDLDNDQCEQKDEYCTDCCNCFYCEGCGIHLGKSGDIDSACYDCFKCESCGCSGDDGGDETSEMPSMGSIAIPPWEERGIVVKLAEVTEILEENSWKKLWDIDHEELDVCQSMADFYLLDGIAHMVFNACTATRQDPGCQVIAAEAKQYQDALVAFLDKNFRAYVDMAIGGELRHHRSTGDVLRRPRWEAWLDWFVLRKKVGPQALDDAAILFEDFSSGGFGGKPWAAASRLLYSREINQFDPRTFVDRVFNAQHNGGSLLNKINWNVQNPPKWQIGSIAAGLGNAHAANPTCFGPLLAVASDSTIRLFGEWWVQSNRVLREHRLPVTPKPTWADGGNREGLLYTYGMISFRLDRHHRWGWYDEKGRPHFSAVTDVPRRKPDLFFVLSDYKLKSTDKDGFELWVPKGEHTGYGRLVKDGYWIDVFTEFWDQNDHDRKFYKGELKDRIPATAAAKTFAATRKALFAKWRAEDNGEIVPEEAVPKKPAMLTYADYDAMVHKVTANAKYGGYVTATPSYTTTYTNGVKWAVDNDWYQKEST